MIGSPAPALQEIQQYLKQLPCVDDVDCKVVVQVTTKIKSGADKRLIYRLEGELIGNYPETHFDFRVEPVKTPPW